MLADKYLWNEHTALVMVLFVTLEEDYPNIDHWYEIKQAHDQMRLKGAAVIELGLHALIGCPRNRELNEYLNHLELS